MPIFIPDLFTGYINGRRAAIQDNWQDAKNYNEVMKGQLDNALAMQTMADSARRSNASANVADMNQALTGARTDNELDLLNKQRANNLNALKAQLEAIQTQFNIDLMNTDAYKNYMLGHTQLAAGQAGQVGQTGQAGQTGQTGQPPVNPNLVPQGTSSINPENSPKWNLLDAETQNYVRNYLTGHQVGSQADLDSLIDKILERKKKPEVRAERAQEIAKLNPNISNPATSQNATPVTEITESWN